MNGARSLLHSFVFPFFEHCLCRWIEGQAWNPSPAPGRRFAAEVQDFVF